MDKTMIVERKSRRGSTTSRRPRTQLVRGGGGGGGEGPHQPTTSITTGRGVLGPSDSENKTAGNDILSPAVAARIPPSKRGQSKTTPRTLPTTRGGETTSGNRTLLGGRRPSSLRTSMVLDENNQKAFDEEDDEGHNDNTMMMSSTTSLVVTAVATAEDPPPPPPPSIPRLVGKNVKRRGMYATNKKSEQQIQQQQQQQGLTPGSTTSRRDLVSAIPSVVYVSAVGPVATPSPITPPASASASASAARRTRSLTTGAKNASSCGGWNNKKALFLPRLEQQQVEDADDELALKEIFLDASTISAYSSPPRALRAGSSFLSHKKNKDESKKDERHPARLLLDDEQQEQDEEERKRKESARFGESAASESSNDPAAAPRPPQRQPSNNNNKKLLNPNAPVFLPPSSSWHPRREQEDHGKQQQQQQQQQPSSRPRSTMSRLSIAARALGRRPTIAAGHAHKTSTTECDDEDDARDPSSSGRGDVERRRLTTTRVPRTLPRLTPRSSLSTTARPTPMNTSTSNTFLGGIHPLALLSSARRTTTSPPRPTPKVTVISEEFKVFVIDNLLSENDCDWILHCAEQHDLNATSSSGRRRRAETWRKLYTHTRFDLPCCEVLPLRPLTNYLLMYIRQIVAKTWKAPRRAAYSLVPRSWKEPHLLRYRKKNKDPPSNSGGGQQLQQQHPEAREAHGEDGDHTGMVMHYDGGDLTWHLMLSSNHHQQDGGGGGVAEHYTGGGTYFRCLRKTILLRKGQVLVHPGNLYHRGVDITSGTRTLMVCFMDGYDPNVNDPSKPEDDSEEFQRNIVTV